MAFIARKSIVIVGAAASPSAAAEFATICGGEPLVARFNELNGLANALSRYGIQTVDVNCLWPRDHFVFHNNKFHTKKQVGYFAEGGALIFGDDFAIAPITLPLAVKLSEDETRKKLCNLYDVSRVHFIPVRSGFGHRIDHIDLSVLLLQSLGKLFVDASLYEKARTRFDKISDTEGLDCVSMDGFSLNFGANSLDFLDDSGKLIVLSPKPKYNSPFVVDEDGLRVLKFTYADDSLPSALSSVLLGSNATVIDLDFKRFQPSGGSIRCKTNVLPADFDLDLIADLCDD